LYNELLLPEMVNNVMSQFDHLSVLMLLVRGVLVRAIAGGLQLQLSWKLWLRSRNKWLKQLYTYVL